MLSTSCRGALRRRVGNWRRTARRIRGSCGCTRYTPTARRRSTGRYNRRISRSCTARSSMTRRVGRPRRTLGTQYSTDCSYRSSARRTHSPASSRSRRSDRTLGTYSCTRCTGARRNICKSPRSPHRSDRPGHRSARLSLVPVSGLRPGRRALPAPALRRRDSAPDTGGSVDVLLSRLPALAARIRTLSSRR